MMSLKRRIAAAEKHCGLRTEPIEQDRCFPYVVTGEHFGTICQHEPTVFPPPPDRTELLRFCTPEQADDIWRRHYGGIAERVRGFVLQGTSRSFAKSITVLRLSLIRTGGAWNKSPYFIGH